MNPRSSHRPIHRLLSVGNQNKNEILKKSKSTIRHYHPSSKIGKIRFCRVLLFTLNWTVLKHCSSRLRARSSTHHHPQDLLGTNRSRRGFLAQIKPCFQTINSKTIQRTQSRFYLLRRPSNTYRQWRLRSNQKAFYLWTPTTHCRPSDIANGQRRFSARRNTMHTEMRQRRGRPRA